MTDYSESIARALAANGKTADKAQLRLLSDYLNELLRVNEYMNLTAITDPEDAIVKNIADCVLCADFIPEKARLLDVGSGAGLPSFPIAIMRPDVKVTALDATAKKVNFITDTANMLGLSNLRAVCERAEILAKKGQYREAYDAVCARAVARMNVLSELCLPFVKVGGVFVAMKSRLTEEELTEASGAVATLGGKSKRVDRFDLLGTDEPLERTVITVKKGIHTPPAFPRAYARITSHPL